MRTPRLRRRRTGLAQCDCLKNVRVLPADNVPAVTEAGIDPLIATGRHKAIVEQVFGKMDLAGVLPQSR